MKNANLKIEYVPIETLTPYEKNARKHLDFDVDVIAKSIEEFGMNDPIGVWGDKNIIIEGHGRLLALKKLGYKEVPIIRLDHLNDEQRKAYALAHNRSAELSSWDDDVLFAELDALEHDFDLESLGFGEFLKIEEEEIEPHDDEFDVNQFLKETAVSKLGDIYVLGKHRLMCGDSTKKEDVEILVNNEKADMVFTDPPYGIDVVGDNGTIGKENKAKAGVYSKVIGDENIETARKAYEILVQYSDKQILWGGNYFVNLLPFSDGWIIWDKRVNSPSNNFADGEMAWCSFHTRVRIYHHLWMGMIQEGQREKRLHPTQKPIRMLSEILQDFTNEGDIILDVFGGSGSTLIACEQLKRKCKMMELDPKYVDVIVKRYLHYMGSTKDCYLIRNGEKQDLPETFKEEILDE